MHFHTMHLCFDEHSIVLYSPHEFIRKQWQFLFEFGVMQLAKHIPRSAPTATIYVNIEEELPELPEVEPFFIDTIPYNVAAYHVDKYDVVLHFRDGAYVRLAPPPTTPVQIVLTPQLVARDRFVDVLMTALAALLRPLGYFMVHAFGASFAGKAVLLIGQSGSGKTSTGLNLITNGWGFLGNDVILLKQSNAGMVALPSPGNLTIHPKSIDLLPVLKKMTVGLPISTITHKYHVPVSALEPALVKEPMPVRLLCFPRVLEQPSTSIHTLPRAMALAQLMEESIDRWDTTYLSAHTTFLQQLVQQTSSFSLMLGKDVIELPAMLHDQLKKIPH